MLMAKVSKTEPKALIITLNYDFLNISNSPLSSLVLDARPIVSAATADRARLPPKRSSRSRSR